MKANTFVIPARVKNENFATGSELPSCALSQPECSLFPHEKPLS